MVPHRYPAKTLPTRSDTDSPAPRSSSMRALDASAALATRARSIAAPRRASREETRDAPEDTPAAPDAAPNEVARSRHSTSVPREKERVRRSLGVRRPPAAPTKPGKKKAVAKTERFVRVDVEQGSRTDIEKTAITAWRRSLRKPKTEKDPAFCLRGQTRS